MIRNEDWSTMRRLLFMHGAMGAPLKEYEAEGNPAVFETNVAKPLTGFTIPFTPVQTGSGDPSPQNPRPIIGRQGLTAYRTGVNLLEPIFEDGIINKNTGAAEPNNDYIRSKNFVPVKGGANYCAVFGGQYKRVYWYDSSKTFISSNTTSTSTKTAPDNACFFKIALTKADNPNPETECAFNYPSTETTYSPYTGASYPVTFPALGKNLQNPKNVINGYFTTTDGVTRVYASSSGRTVWMPCKPNTTYALSKMQGGRRLNVYFSEDAPEPGTVVFPGENVSAKGNYEAVRTSPANAKYMISFVWLSTVDTEITADEMINSVQVEEGATVTAFEPFDNTIYGGTIDAVTGVLTVERAKITDDGSGSLWSIAPQEQRNRFSRSTTPKAKASSTSKMVCNYAKSRNSSGSAVWDAFIGSTSNFLIYVPSEIDTPQAWADYLSEHPIEFVYELDEPIEIPLSDIPVPVTLKGDNTIWTDTNGSNTIKYKKKG